jgi:hypothetical protein
MTVSTPERHQAVVWATNGTIPILAAPRTWVKAILANSGLILEKFHVKRAVPRRPPPGRRCFTGNTAAPR